MKSYEIVQLDRLVAISLPKEYVMRLSWRLKSLNSSIDASDFNSVTSDKIFFFSSIIKDRPHEYLFFSQA